MRDWLEWMFQPWNTFEVRSIKESQVIQKWWCPRYDPWQTIVEYITEADRSKRDVYVGVLPRKSMGGTADHVADIASVVWVDLDAKDFGGDKGASLSALLKFPLPPSCIVDSGHGFHAYWGIGPASPAEVEEINKALAKWLGGDACWDRARVLRVPGTTNWKDPQKPVPVRLLKLDTLRTYDLGDFNEMVESLHASETKDRGWKQAQDISDRQRRQDAPDWLKDLINTEPPPGSRSEAEFRAGFWMARLGYDDESIFTMLMNSPVGVKAQERGEKWAEAEVQRIRRKA